MQERNPEWVEATRGRCETCGAETTYVVILSPSAASPSGRSTTLCFACLGALLDRVATEDADAQGPAQEIIGRIVGL
jgi:hypothetical protein